MASGDTKSEFGFGAFFLSCALNRFSYNRVAEMAYGSSGKTLWAFGPIVKWYNGAFALRRREFDSPWVHISESSDDRDHLRNGLRAETLSS